MDSLPADHLFDVNSAKLYALKTAEAMEEESFPSLLPFPAACDPQTGSASLPGKVSSGQLYNRLFSVFGSNRCITLTGKEIYSFLP